MLARKISGVITIPFRAIAITAYLATAAPLRMLPIIAPAILVSIVAGQGCIPRYDDFGKADAGSEVSAADASDSSPDTTEIITAQIKDQNLLKMIRKGLNKGIEEDISLNDALSMTTLIADSSHIYYLDGLECFTNLAILGLNFNPIEDISPLAGLTNLIYLNLYGDKVSDLSPLANLPLIKKLSLGYNLISDISVLLNNPGIGSGDVICLDGNDQIPQWQLDGLEEKDVMVTCAW